VAAILIGQAARGTTADFVVAGQASAFKLVAGASGTLRHIYLHTKVANASLSTLEVRIYADLAGVPGGALAPVKTATYGAITSAIPGGTTSAGVVRYDLGADAFALVSGTTYWIAIRVAGEQFDWQGDAVASAYRERPGATLPDPWNSTGDSVGGNHLTIFGTDAPVPQVVAENVLADTADATAHNVPYPAPSGGILAGDLLLCFVGEDSAAAGDSVTWPAGWTELLDTHDATNAINAACAWKKAAGGESGTFAVTTANAQGGGIRVQCIRGAADPTVTPPELTSATGSSTNPNPPSETASWGAEAGTLWIAAAANDGNVAITAAPASYVDFANTRWANTSGAGVATAWRYLTAAAASEDPGTFTMATEQWVAWTVAVRAASAGGATQTVTLPAIASAEAWGSHTVSPGATTVTLPAIGSAEAWGSHVVAGGPVAVTLPAVSSSETWGSHVVTRGAVTATLPAIASAEAWGASTVSAGAVTVTLTGIPSAEAWGAAAITPPPQTVTLPAVSSSEAWGAATVTQGPAQVSLPGIASAEAWGASTLTRGAVSVTLPAVSSAEAWGASTVSAGAVSVTLPAVSSSEAWGSTVVGRGPVAVTLPAVSSSEAWGAHTITSGPATVTLTGIPSAEAWGAAAVVGAGAVALPGIASAEAWGATVVGRGPVNVSVAGVPTAEAWGAANVTRGPVTVALTGIGSLEAWGGLEVRGDQVVTLAGLASAEAWGAIVVYIVLGRDPGHIDLDAPGHIAGAGAGRRELVVAGHRAGGPPGHSVPTGPGHIV
jgi:hypothetical protein